MMKLRLVSMAMLVALMCAFFAIPAGVVAAKEGNNGHQGQHGKASAHVHTKIGDATVNVTNFSVNGAGQLVAAGTVTDASNRQLATFSDAAVTVQQATGTCTILDLTIAPITLNLFGLVVTTSTIHLVITGQTGPGNLLGNLLCGIAGLLDNPSALSQLLNQILNLLGGILHGGSALTGMAPLNITNFFSSNGQLYAAYTVAGAGGTSVGPFVTAVQAQADPAGCNILHLVLGPIHLNLFGLVIDLNGGTTTTNGVTTTNPIVIDITAVPGPGNLLGNLLCGLAGLLNGGAAPAAVASKLNRILAAL